MGSHKEPELFTSRQRIRRLKAVSGVSHLSSLAFLVLSILWILPQLDSRDAKQINQEIKERLGSRQLLMEALDKLARYQIYYNELHGRFTRDLDRLALPSKLASGTLEELKREYEISVLEVRPNRFLILATGNQGTDRVTMDESHRVNANFVLPPPARPYLLEEADRMLRLKAMDKVAVEGFYSRYWKLVSKEENRWEALGQKNPVMGERHEIEATREVASIFSTVSEQVKQHMGEKPAANAGAKEELNPSEVTEWLNRARLAQHIYKREKGHYARRWEELDAVANYNFAERIKTVKNLRVNPIEIEAEDRGFRMVLEGTSGDLMGEQFVMDMSGSVRQVRYTEALIQQLQQTTNILDNLHFQINPVADDPQQRAQP